MNILEAFKRSSNSISDKKLGLECDLWSNYVTRPLSKFLTIPFLYTDIKPTTIVLFHLFFEIIGAFFLVFNYYIGLFLILIGRILDHVDGNIARAFNKKSAWGRILDEISDMVAKIVFWSIISYILFKESLIIISYLSLLIILIELLSFHISDRTKVYIFESAIKNDKKKKELNLELKKEVSIFYSSSLLRKIVFKILFIFKYLGWGVIFFWTGISFPFLFLSFIFNILYLFVIISFFVKIVTFLYEIFRLFFYNKIILERYST